MAKSITYLPPFYQAYVNQVPEDEVLQALINNQDKMNAFFGQIPEQSANYRYEDNKWTVKQLIGHVIDAERIFSYRALRFSRNDKTPLAGFEENDYVPNSNASNRSLHQLASEFKHLRTSTIDLFMSFTPEMMERYGEANKEQIAVNSIGFVIAGHTIHHYNILKERYKL